MNAEERKQYEVATDEFWVGLPMMGGGGYDDMGEAKTEGWDAIALWGKKGWDLGSWPYVIIFFRTKDANAYEMAYYCEGDVTQYLFHTEKEREEATDEIAYWHWKDAEKPWVSGIKFFVDLPSEMRGAFSSARMEGKAS